jgi:hypothetical protein
MISSETSTGAGPATAKIRLRIIGSSALMLQTDYERGTKDSDVLETNDLTAGIKKRLLDLAGAGTPLHEKHRLYIEFVSSGIPFLPQVALYHPVVALNAALSHFDLEVLDVVDVVVAKLKRFHASDRDDVDAMVKKGARPSPAARVPLPGCGRLLFVRRAGGRSPEIREEPARRRTRLPWRGRNGHRVARVARQIAVHWHLTPTRDPGAVVALRRRQCEVRPVHPLRSTPMFPLLRSTSVPVGSGPWVSFERDAGSLVHQQDARSGACLRPGTVAPQAASCRGTSEGSEPSSDVPFRPQGMAQGARQTLCAFRETRRLEVCRRSARRPRQVRR